MLVTLMSSGTTAPTPGSNVELPVALLRRTTTLLLTFASKSEITMPPGVIVPAGSVDTLSFAVLR